MAINSIIRRIESADPVKAGKVCAAGAVLGALALEALRLGSRISPFALSSLTLSASIIALAMGGAYYFLKRRFEIQTDQLNLNDRQGGANILRFIPFEERDLYVQAAQRVQSRADHRENILRVLSGIPQENRSLFLAQIDQLNLQSYPCVLIFSQIPLAERPSFVQQILSLRLPVEDRLHALAMLRDIPFGQRADFVDSASRLPIQTPTLLRSLLQTGPILRDAFIQDLNRFVLPNMTSDQKLRAVEIFLEIPEAARTRFSEQFSRMIQPRDTVSERLTLMEALSRCPNRDQAIENLTSHQPTFAFEELNPEERASLLQIASAHNSPSWQNLLGRADKITSWWMTPQTKLSLLLHLADISDEKQQAVVELIHFWMGKDARMTLLSTCRDHQVDLRLLTEANHLIQFWMDGLERALLIQQLIQLPNQMLQNLGGMISFWRPIASLEAILQSLGNQPPLPLPPVAPAPQVPPMPAAPHIIGGPGPELNRLEDLREPDPIEFPYQGRQIFEGIQIGWENRFWGHNGETLYVDNQELNRDPRPTLQTLFVQFHQTRRFPVIQYHEGGVAGGMDAGGLTRNFVSHVFKVLREHPNLLSLRQVGDNQLLLPSMELAVGTDSETQENCYKAIGMIFAYALNGHKQIKIGNHFDPLLYQMLHSLTPQEMNQLAQQNREDEIPNPIYKKWLRIYLKNQCPLYFATRDQIGAGWIDRLQETRYQTLLNQVVDTFVNDEGAPLPQAMRDGGIESRADFFELRSEIPHIFKAVQILASSISPHLSRSWQEQKGVHPQDLQNRIEGALTKERVLQAFWPYRRYPNANSREGFLKRWIDQASPEALKKFVWAISGSYTLPEGVSLSSTQTHGSDRLPLFHTCGRSIDLSDYTSYERFNQMLTTALGNLREDGAFTFA